jgi:hypothetical protein
MERELRKLYLQWIAGVSVDSTDLDAKLLSFQTRSAALISKMGGQAASLGALGDFPVPKTLALSPVAGVVYDDMKQAAISASITAGLNSKDAARQMFNAGMGKSYRRLERLARTETTNAYWKNSWDSVADLPLLVMLWSVERGPRTCQWCISRDGLVVDDTNIRDHPNGRCTLIPTLRSQVKYKGTLQPDGSVTMDPRWTDQKVKGAKAEASAGPTTAAQRDPLSGKSNPAAPSTAQAVHRSVQASTEDVASGMRAAEAQRKAMEKTKFKRGKLNADTGWDYDTEKSWKSYTEGGGREINNMLRDPVAFAKTELGSDEYFAPLLSKQADDLAALISKNQLTQDVYVARGVTVADSFNPAALKSGDLFADPAFMSTTSSMADALDFASGRGSGASGWTFITKAPTGTNAVAGADYQYELIFKAGQQQRVVSLDAERRIVYTEMIP